MQNTDTRQTNGQTNSKVVLPAVCDTASTPALVERLRAANDRVPLPIDASSVEGVGYSTVQALISAMRSRDLRVIGASPAFLAAFEDAGLLPPHVTEMPQEPEPTTVSDAAGVASADESEQAQPAREPGAPTRILTIDDSKTMRDMLRMTLVAAGFDVLQAVDGQDGLNVLSGAEVDIVITDINMPRMDGYEVIRRMRDNPAYKKTPILVLTTESDPEKRDVGRGAGATGWLVKPFDPERLVATVRKVIPEPAAQA